MENASMFYLALFDFVPNIAFLVGAYFLVRIAYLVRNKICGNLVIAGAFLILLGGFLQATWKLLYTVGVADILLIRNIQFIVMAPGFVILMIALFFLVRQSSKTTAPPILGIVPWKLPFLIVMVLASLIAQGLLIYISISRRAFLAGVGFFIAFICLLAMGGMAGSQQTIAQQWAEESVNAFGQVSFAAGSFLLYLDFKTSGC